MARPVSPAPLIGIVAVTVLVARFTTDTLFPISLDTYPYGCAAATTVPATSVKSSLWNSIGYLSSMNPEYCMAVSGAPLLTLDGGEQFGGSNRLGDIVVHAGRETPFAIA